MYSASCNAHFVSRLTRVKDIVYCVVCAQEQSGVPTLTGPIARRINVANSTGGEEELISAVIPDDVLVKILEERLAVSWLSFIFCDIC